MFNNLTDNNQHFNIIRISLWVIFIREYSNKIFWIFSIIHNRVFRKIWNFQRIFFSFLINQEFHGILYLEKFWNFVFKIKIKIKILFFLKNCLSLIIFLDIQTINNMAYTFSYIHIYIFSCDASFYKKKSGQLTIYSTYSRREYRAHWYCTVVSLSQIVHVDFIYVF